VFRMSADDPLSIIGAECVVHMKVLAVNSTNEEIRDISFILQIRWPQSSIISANDDSTCLEHIETELPDLVILDISKSGYGGVE